jgi:hypothetical protein
MEDSMRKLVMLLGCVSLVWGGEFYYMSGGKRVELTPVESDTVIPRSSQNILHFKDRQGKDIAIPNRLLMKLKDRKNLDSYLAKYHMKIVKEYANNTFLLETDSPKSAMDSANALSQESDVVYAQPDLIRKWNLR